MSVEKCDCIRNSCEFFDASTSTSYTRAELEDFADELTDKLADIERVL
jgi:hypothetical protein